MKIVKKYSHLNGIEYMLVHKKDLYDEIVNVISQVDADKFRTKISDEKTMKGKLLYSPGEINNEFKRIFESLSWESQRRDFYVADSYEIVKNLEPLSLLDQKKYLTAHQLPLYKSYNQTDFVKDKGNYSGS